MADFSPALCRDARRVLAWSRRDLETVTRVPQAAIAAYEQGALQPHRPWLATIRAALEEAGAEFIRDFRGRDAVRLRCAGAA